MRDPKFIPNKALKSILSEIDWKNDSFEMVFFSFGKMERNSQSRKISNAEVSYPKKFEDLVERVSWEFLDEDDLNMHWRNANNLQRNNFDKPIDLFLEGQKGRKGDSAVIQMNSGAYASYVMVLDARQLVKAYKELGGDSIFSLNIRNYIGSTSTNKQIIKTAETSPDNFFIFNNGVSCLSTKVSVFEDRLTVTGLQVINGAQTVKALCHVSNEIERVDSNVWNSTKPKVLVRITEIPEGYGQTGKIREQITQFNNTQNVVKISDFRSNDTIHLELKRLFEECYRKNKRVNYISKRTDKAGSNVELVKMEEFAKCIYAFMYNFVDFSGSSSFLFTIDSTGGYTKVFGDGVSIYEQMDKEEFRLRAGIYWIAQEIASDLKTTRLNENNPDDRAALERKWCVVFAFSVAIRSMYPGDLWKDEVRKLYKGDWSFNDNSKGLNAKKFIILLVRV